MQISRIILAARFSAMGIASRWWPRRSRPQDIPKKLTPEALEKAIEEARFLRDHAVDVKELAPDERPGPPRQA
jgi:hypothetical protein